MGNVNWGKRKILKARTMTELKKDIQCHLKMAYVQASEIKYFENDSKPYQVLVVKKWLVEEEKYDSSESKEIA